MQVLPFTATVDKVIGYSYSCLCTDNAELFEMEEADLMKDLRSLPRNSAVRKINELVKRVRLSKVHAYIIGYLREQMPMFMGREKKQKQVKFISHELCM